MKAEEYILVVPSGSMTAVAPKGTAFVAKRTAAGYLVHYEPPGNAVNVVTFEDRVRHAAGRLHDSYPTSKMVGGGPEHWIEVGSVIRDARLGWIIAEIADPDVLSQWDCDEHHEGGSPRLHEETRTREISRALRGGT